jgi:dephospho-CoA kinase
VSAKALTVALTGGIGSGKTAAGEFFAELGALVVDSDQLSRDVVARGTEGFDAVIARFGDGILQNGEISRTALGELVFSDPIARKDLEAIVHPAVREAWEQLVHTASPGAILINQIPLLVETQGSGRFNRVITVSAPIEQRRERLRARGMTDIQIARVLESQVDDAAREAAAQFVIANDGDLDHLLRQVENVFEKLQGLAKDLG